MPQSFASLHVHVIFGTRGREPLITPDVQPRLPEYLGGILSARRCIPVAIGGMPDHVHILCGLDRQISLSGLVRLLKAKSSRWIHETFTESRGFAWQTGYGAFSVSRSRLEEVTASIARQAEHHRKTTFREESIAFLDRHGLAFDESTLWS